MSKSKLLNLVAVISLLISFVVPNVVSAADSKADVKQKVENTTKALNPDISGAVTQSYNADGKVQIGMIVKLKDKEANTVVPLESKDVAEMLGIVVPANNAPIVLTPETITKQQVLVATTGNFPVLVTNQNGPIKTGDWLTISAISGVAMKADQDQTQVIGKATSGFTGTSNVVGNVKIKDTLGRESTVSIGRAQVDLRISHNPLYSQEADYVPGFLAKAANNVANKPVSVARIYLGMALLIITAFVTAVLLYSGIRSGMIAVGRNPLSKKSIMKSLFQTVIAGLIIFVAGVFAVYLLLKL